MKTRIQEIKQRLEAATPGPWFISGDVNGENLNIIQTNHTTRDVWQIPRVKGDYELIANSRQDISDLLAVVEVYEAGLKDVHDEIHDEHCEDDTHCNWCESLIMTLTKAQEIFSSSES